MTLSFVGMTRFELATSGPPDRCATGLRHIPFVVATTSQRLIATTFNQQASCAPPLPITSHELLGTPKKRANAQKRVQRYCYFLKYANKKRFF